MTAVPDFPPALLLLIGAFLVPILPKMVRPLVGIVVPLFALAMLLGFERDAVLFTAPFAGFDLILLQVNPINFVFGIIFLLITALASLYAWHIKDTTQQVAALLYGAGALGVTFAGDFFSLLIFWELMAIASAWLVFARRTPESTRAGFRYLIVHFVGGSLLFGGIILLYAQTGSLLLRPLEQGSGWAAWLILLGVGVNVALPPFHSWLPDAYPKATITGAIFMSALTTKSAVYILVVLFAGWEMLIYWGVIMALFGATYAFICNDIRQVLAYHIVSQVGFMVTGVGIGTEMALNGTIAHAYSHILYKALLFMGGGAILYAAGTSKLTELGNLRRHLPGVTWLFMIGAFSISGVPLWNGFISKSITISAATYDHHWFAMFGLFLAGVGTFLSIGLKIPYFAFWGPERNLTLKPIPKTMYAAMGILAFLCTLYGVWPDLLYRILPFDKPYHPFTAYHFIESIQLLAFTFVGFWILRAKVAPKDKLNLDSDWLYRRAGPVVALPPVLLINRVFEACAHFRRVFVDQVSARASAPGGWFRAVGQLEPSTPRPAVQISPLASSVGFILLFTVILGGIMAFFLSGS